MPDDSGAGEKTEEATPKKRRDARMDGQVAVSQDLNSVAVLLLGFAALFVFAPMIWTAMREALNRAILEGFLIDITPQTAMQLFYDQFGESTILVLCFGLVTSLGALAILMAQVGIVFTPKPLQPKFERVNPLSGLKRIFGLRGLMKFVFSLLKLVLVTTVAYFTISAVIPDLTVYTNEISASFAHAAEIIMLVGLIIASVVAIVAAFDFMYQRFQQEKDLRMSKQEIKEEMKQSDGDPLVRAKIRQIQREMAQRRMMEEVPKADVVITNPTHVAVALRYQAGEMAAPVCVAKGYDDVAQRIKTIAAEHNIPQVENIPLARALAKQVEIGQQIPGDFYDAVAEVLSYVYRLNEKATARHE